MLRLSTAPPVATRPPPPSTPTSANANGCRIDRADARRASAREHPMGFGDVAMARSGAGCHGGTRSLPAGRAPRRLAGGARVLRHDCECAGWAPLGPARPRRPRRPQPPTEGISGRVLETPIRGRARLTAVRTSAASAPEVVSDANDQRTPRKPWLSMIRMSSACSCPWRRASAGHCLGQGGDRRLSGVGGDGDLAAGAEVDGCVAGVRRTPLRGERVRLANDGVRPEGDAVTREVHPAARLRILAWRSKI